MVLKKIKALSHATFAEYGIAARLREILRFSDCVDVSAEMDVIIAVVYVIQPVGTM